MITGKETIKIIRTTGGTLDDFGQIVNTVPEITEVKNVLVAPGTGENTQEITGVETRVMYTIYSRNRIQTSPKDVVEVRGEKFAPLEQVREFISPIGSRIKPGWVLQVVKQVGRGEER